MTKTKSKTRKTPWDTRAVALYANSSTQAPIGTHSYEKLDGGVRLHGVYVFDPRVCTSLDMRQFFWAGLQLLDSKIKSLGLPPEEVHQLMLASFDTFHDAANGLWDALGQVTAKAGETRSMVGAVATCYHFMPAVGYNGSGRAVYSTSLPVLPVAKATELVKQVSYGTVSCGVEAVGSVGLVAPLNEPEDADKTQEAEDFPVADFYEPAGFGWTPEGYEVRSTLKRYCEDTNAHR